MRFATGRSNANFGPAWLALLLLSAFVIIGPNAGLALYSCFVFVVGTRLLLRPGEPPILLFVFFYEWVRAAFGPFYANILGVPLDAIVQFPGQNKLADFLQLTSILVLAIAMRFAAGRTYPGLFSRVQAFVAARPLGFWLRLYVGTWIFSVVCDSLAWRSAGLEQLLLVFDQIQWAAFMLLTMATFAVPGRKKTIWTAVFLVQFVLSLGGFFSTFKDVFFYSLIGLAASNVRLKARAILPGALLSIILLSLAIVWTSIKKEYRAFVDQGTGQQVVLVGYFSRLAELGNLASGLDEHDLAVGTDELIHRFMYFNFFGAVLDRVPNDLPYARGQLWGDSVLRCFMPRLFFPDKSAVNDSTLTNHYTGLRVAGYEEGASISMGFMAEAYIDFGPILMFLPIAALGLFLGYFYRWLLVRPGPQAVLGAALAPFALMQASNLETSVLKLVPSLVLSIIPCWVVLKFLSTRLFGLRRMGRAYPGIKRIGRIRPVKRIRPVRTVGL
jgi:hypothetical protein